MLVRVCVCALLVVGCVAAAPRPQATWLLVSDIHLDPSARGSVPAKPGKDTNPALLASSLAEMKRVAPDPQVVVLGGDFLAHHFKGNAIATMQSIATQFGRAFPHARFLVTLGNNDDPCGDYHMSEDSAYLRKLAAVWAPLVNRNNASPGFATAFAHGGYYVAALPVNGERAIVLDNVYWSFRYKNSCGAKTQTPGADEFAWLERTLSATPKRVRNLVLMHIPIGEDAFSTAFVHGAAVVPLLDASDDAHLQALLGDPTHRVSEVIASHLHRQEVRAIGRIPVMILGSISPVYRGDPTFVLETVSASGAALRYTTYDYSETANRWSRRPGFHPYVGDRYARCAQTHLDAASFAACAGVRSKQRWMLIIAAVLLILVVGGAGGLWYARRR